MKIGVWVDGAMPSRAETVRGYVQAMHQTWLQDVMARQPNASGQNGLMTIETRYRYNPDVKSLPAIVPAVIPLLLMMIPSMLSALSVVREKELGSIINLHVYEKPDRGHFWYGDYYIDPGDAVFRNDRSSCLAGRAGSLDW